MFRLSQYMHALKADPQNKPARPVGSAVSKPTGSKPTGPVVIWNLIRRCNLTCKHCYATSADKDFPGELNTNEVFNVMDELKGFAVPVLILSGGEPLMRPEFEIEGLTLNEVINEILKEIAVPR